MPFAAEFQQIYSSFIVGALQEAGYEVSRADDIVSQQNILQDVVQSTIESDLVVADLTGANPNVYYELGIAHGGWQARYPPHAVYRGPTFRPPFLPGCVVQHAFR